MRLLHGDCLYVLKTLDENSVDSIVTDPPYGLGTVKDLPSLLREWMSGGTGEDHVGAAGFMGKAWDKCVPPPIIWKECYRVLKPGGHMLVFAGTRTQDLMGISVRLAGFDFVGIERELEFVEIANARITHARELVNNIEPAPVSEPRRVMTVADLSVLKNNKRASDNQLDLFSGIDKREAGV